MKTIQDKVPNNYFGVIGNSFLAKKNSPWNKQSKEITSTQKVYPRE